MSCSKLSKKRKIEEECRVFNEDWTERYFFADVGEKAACLICYETVAEFKEYYLKHHFQTKHANLKMDIYKWTQFIKTIIAK